ncbi:MULTISPECIES: dihydrolipoamide acetyltransferase family protein [Mycobacterium]|jgi:pyruvate dehydrogenase E2 component (dihydrolipoamide acetyltransferase)|uniref:Dihydrolipoamide acetyltransferase component of pyruvate dehydrogenase complex n=1 Tax=Mycobacterium gordonae TaxID=1778 RepID=A0A1A6BHU6_MYCGO|nr:MULTISPECIES: dihydrolipoamide acetyltransferase family protein [Mycobacterium]MBI2700634.1 2-oxo acid dehydrogenase subunit E2 [Mycobacterium sp.]MBX9982461.1 2-oxo acid dehydrogenase subunit E2 [Mycobacterium gordonae]MCQ4362893.1 2-oxo acid dehydrogenase subunit E2 [Mycobacterium gordonae]MCV7006393.1 2-oxo acid dehydrogenase subunit E2 [Mycobacterium gordonae]OBS01794.1 branched-chain alpha-keto acid dehydrogenase subunit E2 [Mycobacterium gordonae]
MIEFKMPALGSDMDEGTLNEWLVKPGDKVSRGQVVAVIETTKAAVEIECWQEGTIDELVVPVGETVEVGTVLATLREAGETVAATAPVTAEQPQKKAARKRAPKAPGKAPQAAPQPATAAPAPARPTGPQHRRWVSPAARRLAANLSVDLDGVSGTGPGGAVTIVDVEHAAATRQPVKKPALAPKPAGERMSMAERGAAMRQSIAAAMSRSKREIPHYYLADEILMDTALTWLTARNAQRPITERVLPAVLQLKAVALAAQRFKEFSGFWREDGYQPAPAVHVGVAISLRGGGLVAPAIHDVAEKKLDELMNDLTDLVARARAGSLRSSEMSDPTITVTNLGDQGVDTVFGVIYPPQVALVGFGKTTQRVCVIDGGIRVVNAVQGTLAADHRASDGHRGALFLAAINELLQQPDVLEK